MRAEQRGPDGGFTTAVFASIAFGLALVAAGGLMLARAGFERVEHDTRLDQERWALDGIAVAASARLLSENGSPSLAWSEPSSYGDVAVTLEPEGLKISPFDLTRPDNLQLFQSMIGPVGAAELARSARGLVPAADGTFHREQIASLASSERWRECGLTLISPYSQLTAFALAPLSSPTGSGDNRHAGQFWRVTVNAPDGAWLDRVVRMTGQPDTPYAIIDEGWGHRFGNHRASCLSEALRDAGRSS